MGNRSLYVVPKTLDAQTRIFGLPIDEFVVGGLISLSLFLNDCTILGMVIPALAVCLMRMVKKGQSSAWIINLCYWYFPSTIMRYVLMKTPESVTREYLS